MDRASDYGSEGWEFDSLQAQKMFRKGNFWVYSKYRGEFFLFRRFFMYVSDSDRIDLKRVTKNALSSQNCSSVRGGSLNSSQKSTDSGLDLHEKKYMKRSFFGLIFSLFV